MTTPAAKLAIVGIGCRFPGAPDATSFWRLLREGRDAVRPWPGDRWDAAWFDPDPKRPGTTNSRVGGFLDDVSGFDAEFFWISAPEAARMDPQHRLLLEVAFEAVEDAGMPVPRLAGSKTGVFVGMTTMDYFRLYERERINGFETTGNACAIAANRISYALDLRGPSLALDTTCSSSLVAVHLASQALRAGECDVALAGGVNLMLIPDGAICFTKLGVTSPDGACRAFDARADGIVRGEGAAIVVLKPLAQACADGDHIYAVLRGSALNQNGLTNGLMAPSVPAQAALLRSAYEAAGVSGEEIDYIEAHGTGTALGDAMEARALGLVVGQGRGLEAPCPIGSVKTNLGHLEAASGVASLVKAALSLREGQIPPSLHFEAPNPHVNLAELGLEVVTRIRPWRERNGAPALAGVSSFGFGGANAHVVLEAPPERAPVDVETAPQLVPLSAKTAEALGALALRWIDWLRRGPGAELSLLDVGFSARQRRTHHNERAAFIASSAAELATQLEGFVGCAVPRRGPASTRGRVAFLLSRGDELTRAQVGRWRELGISPRVLVAEGASARALAEELAAERIPVLAFDSPDVLPAALAAGKIDVYLDCDAGGLAGRVAQAAIRADLRAGFPIASPDFTSEVTPAVLRTAGALYCANVCLDFEALYPTPGRCVSLPLYPWQRKRHWYESTREPARPTPTNATQEPIPWHLPST